MDSDKDSRDCKSRFVLRKLKNGVTRYRTTYPTWGHCGRYGYINCPFYDRGIAASFDSQIDHAGGIGRSRRSDLKPHVKAKHAAYYVFLREYVKGTEPFYLPAPDQN